MASVNSEFIRDANRVPITTLGLIESKAYAFDGSAGNGATGTYTLFTVTGKVAVNVYAICTEDLASAGGGTLAIGVAGSTACLCDQQNATAIDNHEVWHNSALAIGANVAAHLHPVDQNVILTIATSAVTNGELTFYCNWVPLDSSSSLVAA